MTANLDGHQAPTHRRTLAPWAPSDGATAPRVPRWPLAARAAATASLAHTGAPSRASTPDDASWQEHDCDMAWDAGELNRPWQLWSIHSTGWIEDGCRSDDEPGPEPPQFFSALEAESWAALREEELRQHSGMPEWEAGPQRPAIAETTGPISGFATERFQAQPTDTTRWLAETDLSDAAVGDDASASDWSDCDGLGEFESERFALGLWVDGGGRPPSLQADGLHHRHHLPPQPGRAQPRLSTHDHSQASGRTPLLSLQRRQRWRPNSLAVLRTAPMHRRRTPFCQRGTPRSRGERPLDYVTAPLTSGGRHAETRSCVGRASRDSLACMSDLPTFSRASPMMRSYATCARYAQHPTEWRMSRSTQTDSARRFATGGSSERSFPRAGRLCL